MDWASEIINLLEKEIRYDLSSKLDAFFAQHGVHVDSEWKPDDTTQTHIQDRILDKEMEKDSVPEEIGSVAQTKDGFWFLS
tara:strand:- start:107 stop:349 length:243 start_codon:yes stop_codon:yes gene_type:complete